MTHVEKVKKVREMTFSPVNKVNDALKRTNGDVDAAVELLVKEKQADANEMANRAANACVVYSYVHNNRVGAMVVLACQTDFVARNEAFLGLAKDICMHIVSAPTPPQYVNRDVIPQPDLIAMTEKVEEGIPENKPEPVKLKILCGRWDKLFSEICLVEQKFVKDNTKTIDQLIKDVSSTLGEKIEVKRFVKMVAQ